MISIERLIQKAETVLAAETEPHSLAFIDVDFFLRYCIKFTPDICNTVMQRITAFFSSAFENEVLLHESGGDEFLIICRKKDRGAAEAMLRSTLAAFRGERFFAGLLPGGEGYEKIRLTFSAGIAESRDGDRAERTVGKAYTALLLAKARRRNCVLTYSDAAEPEKGRVLLEPALPLIHEAGAWGRAGCSFGGAAETALFWEPQAIAAASVTDAVYIADQNNHRVVMLRGGRVFPVFGGSGCGRAETGRLNKPTALHAVGNHLFVADTGNDQLVMLEDIGKTGNAKRVRIVCGTGEAGAGGDGGPAMRASLNKPGGVASDKHGNLYINDIANNVVRRISTDGIIETFAGSGRFGFSGDGGGAAGASFQEIYGICVDSRAEVLYIADYLNNRIRAADLCTGKIRTAAGGGSGGRGDGGDALCAVLNRPSAVCTDASGNLYIAESGSHSVRIVRRRDRRIFTLAGGLGAGYSPVGDAAGTRLANPNSLCISGNNLMILDGANSRLIRVPLSGICGING